MTGRAGFCWSSGEIAEQQPLDCFQRKDRIEREDPIAVTLGVRLRYVIEKGGIPQTTLPSPRIGQHAGDVGGKRIPKPASILEKLMTDKKMNSFINGIHDWAEA